jgi:nucleotide-binding universal stress UspA family protein
MTKLREGIAFEHLVAAVFPDEIVVMISRVRSGFLQWALDSVADSTIRHTSALVLIVRPNEITRELTTAL